MKIGDDGDEREKRETREYVGDEDDEDDDEGFIKDVRAVVKAENRGGGREKRVGEGGVEERSVELLLFDQCLVYIYIIYF